NQPPVARPSFCTGPALPARPPQSSSPQAAPVPPFTGTAVPHSKNAPDPAALEAALWIDVRASLALCRAALRGLSVSTPAVRASVVESLRDEAAVVAMEGARGSQAVVALIDGARRELEDAA
ncbi:MAG: hypothetical protein JWQ29_2035, partial [Phenylobacterium sp.]|nr:hypothetical protein [Phenylobacterium sp.]